MADSSATALVALFAVGIGGSFLAADPHTPTSRALAASLALIGVVIWTNVLENMGFLPGIPGLWARLHSIAETAALLVGFEWILRIGRTARCSGSADGCFGEGLIRFAQGLALVYGAVGLALPEIRSDLLDHAFDPGTFSRPEYYLFAVPFYGSLTVAQVRVVQLLRSDLDESERVRLLALMVSTPFLISGLIAPGPLSPFTTAVGEIVFLAGSVRHHVLQGQRGQFLARFLSPQVASLVRERGLSRSMQQDRIELSVVACDLRGFTAFSESSAPEDVMRVLSEYYTTLGDVVTTYGGTIKDLAGDGLLALVGAPLPVPDHAARALRMAVEIRDRSEAMLSRWRKLGVDLGIGIGVASGFVTVGPIAGAGRLEYAAVGPPVNLASRLCDRAADGQVLVSERTVGSLGDETPGVRWIRHDATLLKGLARSITVYEIAEPREVVVPAAAVVPAPA